MSSLQLAFLWFRGRVCRERAARWNHQYASGRWEKLKIPAEQARFDTTARLLARHGPPGHVLEIGCGEALLQQRVPSDDYRTWLGVDISAVAIARAQAFANERVHYLAGDMETFDRDASFDVIIFPESIYYSPDPQGLLERYVSFLKPNGRFIVSIFRTKRSDRIWAGLHSITRTVDALATTNELGSWDCEVLVPKVQS
jgi:2-polyprenyl-3-methyl-5-hydroxy-6-metoxy-1,4-benzoquinol methylase